jgi:hypothetical protein
MFALKAIQEDRERAFVVTSTVHEAAESSRVCSIFNFAVLGVLRVSLLILRIHAAFNVIINVVTTRK